jgi:hypothetical protein
MNFILNIINFISNTTLPQWTDIVTIIGVIVAAKTLSYTASQINANAKTNHGQFLLHIDEMLAKHNEVHLSLRPGGKWSKNNRGPKTPKEWAAVDSYMGLFERINILVKDKIISIDVVDQLYGYRITNITANNKIKKNKLDNIGENWCNFKELEEAIIKTQSRRKSWWRRLIHWASFKTIY